MKIINKKLVQKGILIDMYEGDAKNDTLQFPIQYFKHPGAVCVAASPDGTNFFMVKQFRFGTETDILEFPAGKIDDPNEDPILGAHRELQEETGYQAQSLHSLGHILPAPAYIDEIVHLYYGTDLSFIGQNLDDTEDLVIEMHSLPSILEMINNNIITDAKTVALAYKLHYYLHK